MIKAAKIISFLTLFAHGRRVFMDSQSNQPDPQLVNQFKDNNLNNKQEIQSQLQSIPIPIQTSSNQQAEVVTSNQKKQEQQIHSQSIQFIKEDKKQIQAEINEQSAPPSLKPNIILQKQQAAIGDDCPEYIKQYLVKNNFKIKYTQRKDSIIQLKNTMNRTQTLDLNKIQTLGKDSLQLINNFIHPPEELITVDAVKQLMKLQSNDSFLIFAYLPPKEEYDESIRSITKSQFDTFTTSRKLDIQKLEQNFLSLANNSSSNKNSYLIVRSKQVADYLHINPYHIGIPYLINKSSKANGNESNSEWNGERFNISNLSKQLKLKSNIDSETINKLTHFYINKIDSEADVYNKIRQMQMSGDSRKLLLIYTRQQKQEFHHKVQEILEQVARTQKQKVIILKTQNQKVVKSIFNVEPDQSTTIRLFNLHQLQNPLFTSNKQNKNQFYSRSKFKGAFKFENLCQFVSNPNWQQHYQNKSISNIKPASSDDISKLDNTLLLLEKQGCFGCKYAKATFEDLKRISQTLTNNPEMRKRLIYRYRIEQPNTLIGLKLRRFNVFNESLTFQPPLTTPKVYYFSQGKYQDLNIAESFQKLKQTKSSQYKSIFDAVLIDLIKKIRLSSSNPYFQI